jgi:hypothetical protein
MRVGIFIFAITAFLIFNTYHDGKYTKMVIKHKKYIQMGIFAFLGLMFYLMIKNNPFKFKNILLHANNVIKYMPIDKSSMNMISPILDFTSNRIDNNGGGDGDSDGAGDGSFMNSLNQLNPFNPVNNGRQGNNAQERRILQSGKGTKRSVSETKKKYVASMQDWKCGNCKNKLNAWFEVDHKTRLEYGGGNNVENLVALCRECHGSKTAHENM